MIARRRLLAWMTLPAAWPARAADAPLRIATPPGPRAELFERLRPLAAARGVEVRLERRDDVSAVEADLRRGALDAAAFDDGVAFDDANRRQRTGLAVAAASFTLPMGLYSRRLVAPRQVRDGETVAVPAEPAGLARALVLLQNFGLIELRDDVGLHATLRDVTANRRGLRLVPTALDRLVDALWRDALVAMDFTVATRAGLEPARDSIGIEDARTPFGGVLGVRRDRLDEPWLRTLVGVLHGPEMKRFAFERFHDSVRRPW